MSWIFGFIVAYSVPIAIWIVWKRKSDARTFPLIVGMVSYIFISLFRGIARAIVLTDAVKANPWRFYFLVALLSGVFEEVGRYVVFKYAMTNHDRWSDCVSYGIGHGAVEIIFTHRIEDFLFGNMIVGFDFAVVIAFSVAMSVLVFASIYYKDCKKFLAAAVIIHTLYDFIAAFFFTDHISYGMLTLIDLIGLIGMCYFSYRVYRRLEKY